MCLCCSADFELADSTKRKMNLILVSKAFLKTQMLDVWEQVVKWNESLKNAFIKNKT